MNSSLKLVDSGTRAEVSDDVLAGLALELARKEDETLERLCIAVLEDDHRTAKRLARELKRHES